MWNVVRLSDPSGPCRDEVLEVLALAFATDPGYSSLSRVAGNPRPRYLRQIVRASLELHLAARQPVFVIADENEILGVSLVEEPGASLPSFAAAMVVARLLHRTAPTVAFRSGRVALALMRRRPREPHHYLSMLGVRPRAQGRGLGRALLEDLHEVSRRHPASTGAGLDTSNPGNVALYEHFGYEALTHLEVSGVEAWCMFRPNEAPLRELASI